MQIISDNDIRLKFLMGLPVHIDGIGNFYSPPLSEVVGLTESLYSTAVSSILFDKKNLTEQDGLDEHSNFQVLMAIINHDHAFRNFFFLGLSLHLDVSPKLLDSGFVYFNELSDDSILTEDKFEYIKKLVKIANHIPEKTQEEEYKAGNDRARKFMEQLKKQREEIAKVKKQKINLHSIISAVGWKSQSFDLISKLNVYQLYDGYYRLEYIGNYENTMTGIFTGNIDGSKVKLPDINWANIIET
jgi:hypothetical protein